LGQYSCALRWTLAFGTGDALGAGLHTTCSGIECGKRNLGMENIVKLARALKVDVGKLFRGVH